jgi:hypothetical protein
MSRRKHGESALDSEGNIAMETSRHEGVRHHRKWILESHPRIQRLEFHVSEQSKFP